MPTKKRKRKRRKRKTMRKFNRYGGVLKKSTSAFNFSNIQSLKKAKNRFNELQKWAKKQGHYPQRTKRNGNRAWARWEEPSYGPANDFLTKKQQHILGIKQAALEAQMLENERISSKAQMKINK